MKTEFLFNFQFSSFHQVLSNLNKLWTHFAEIHEIIFFLIFTVQWDESHQEVQPICTDEYIDKPRQLVSHKKLCLLPDTQTKLPNGPLQPLKPKEKLEKNVFEGPVRSGRNYDPESRPSPVFEPEEWKLPKLSTFLKQ